MAQGKIFVGVGGWEFAPWRGRFYPAGLPQKRELEYASARFSAVEVNGTYYGLQKPGSYRHWFDETPDDYVFALKGTRFTTNRRVLAEAKSSIDRFFDSGVLELKHKLGPINWQFMATKVFQPDDFAAFLALLPHEIDGQAIRHAVEVRHASFDTADFVALARQHRVAIVLAGDSEFPSIDAVTADFAYVRIMGTTESEALGYSDQDIAGWAKRARHLSEGGRDVFLFVISGNKASNPDAAMAIRQALG